MYQKELGMIRECILEMSTPFQLSLLLSQLEEKHGISDRRLVLMVLDELRDDGLLEYNLKENDIWVYSPVLLAQ